MKSTNGTFSSHDWQVMKSFFASARFIEAELPRIEALNTLDDGDGEVEELNGLFRRYAFVA